MSHVETGLSSFDRSMPEEINRILTDSISDYLFVTDKSGLGNFEREGINRSKIFFVGNVMIDSLVHYLPKIEKRKMINDRRSTSLIDSGSESGMTANNSLPTENYILVTMHRPSNVDDGVRLAEQLKILNRIASKRKVSFPIHPRTKNNIEKFDLRSEISDNFIIKEPIGYLDFIGLVKNGKIPELWEGRAAKRIVQILIDRCWIDN